MRIGDRQILGDQAFCSPAADRPRGMRLERARRYAGAELPRLARRIRRRLRPIAGGPAILMYHRIAVAQQDPWRLAVTPARFEQQLAWLRRRRILMPLTEFAERHRAGRLPAEAVALTFDDGYACNAEVAAPLLERFGAPATIFLATGALAATGEFWWDQLEQIVAAARPGRFDLDLEGWRVSFQLERRRGLRPGGGRAAAYLRLWEMLRPWPPQARRTMLGELARALGAPGAMRPSHRPMTEAQARALASSPLITLGAHTVTHPSLVALSPEARRREIEDSCAACARLTGAAPEVFAYPFGDYDAATVAAVRAAGVSIAVTTDAALVRPGCDSLALPRLQVDDWSAPQLARALDR